MSNILKIFHSALRIHGKFSMSFICKNVPHALILTDAEIEYLTLK